MADLNRSRDRGEADRARAILLTLAGWTSTEMGKAFGVREDTLNPGQSPIMFVGVGFKPPEPIPGADLNPSAEDARNPDARKAARLPERPLRTKASAWSGAPRRRTLLRRAAHRGGVPFSTTLRLTTRGRGFGSPQAKANRDSVAT